MLEKVMRLRDAGAVTRYHTIRTIRRQSLSEHSFGVALLALRVYPNAGSRLLEACLTHDLAELSTGDVPATTKWANPDLHALLRQVEEKFNDENNICCWQTYLDPVEYRVLKWCDMCELVLWCAEEREMGNRYVLPIIDRGLEYLSNLGAPTPQAQELYDDIIKRKTSWGLTLCREYAR